MGVWKREKWSDIKGSKGQVLLRFYIWRPEKVQRRYESFIHHVPVLFSLRCKILGSCFTRFLRFRHKWPLLSNNNESSSTFITSSIINNTDTWINTEIFGCNDWEHQFIVTNEHWLLTKAGVNFHPEKLNYSKQIDFKSILSRSIIFLSKSKWKIFLAQFISRRYTDSKVTLIELCSLPLENTTQGQFHLRFRLLLSKNPSIMTILQWIISKPLLLRKNE